MSILSLRHTWKAVYPYWVVTRLAVLVVGSLTFLVLHQMVRNLSARSKPETERLDVKIYHHKQI